LLAINGIGIVMVVGRWARNRENLGSNLVKGAPVVKMGSLLPNLSPGNRHRCEVEHWYRPALGALC